MQKLVTGSAIHGQHNQVSLHSRRGRLLVPNSFTHRCWLLIRLTGHLLKGLFIASWVFPGLDEPKRRTAMRVWSRGLLAILGVRLRVRPASVVPLPPRCILASNHVSWVDIFVLAARYPAMFVAKAEIHDWPLVGVLCVRAGTIFIERGSRGSAKRTNAVLRSAIERGALISIFPEGTTSDGVKVGQFHAALFQPAIDSAAEVQPAVIRYLDATGQYCDGPNFVGDTTFLQSLWRITAHRRIIANLTLPPRVQASECDRRLLAARVRSSIELSLNSASCRPPETTACPLAALQ